MHDDQTAVRVSWTARDSESGIEHYIVAIGTKSDPESVLAFTDYDRETTTYIQNIYLETFTESSKLYVISVKAINGAGLESDVGYSKSIYVQKADVPGIVFDGRDLYTDASYTVDHTSLAASFFGFESEACNIIGYDWAIGTKEYGTDVLSYTNYGLVMLNETHGQCQIHTELFDDTKYYITVRAVTGCKEQFILSSSDGITFDRNPPIINYDVKKENNTLVVVHDEVLYQAGVDYLSVTSNVTDSNSIDTTSWALGSLPLMSDRYPFTPDFNSLSKSISLDNLQPGESLFLTTNTSDKAGNMNLSSSIAIIADTSAPVIKNINCSKYLSVRQSLLTCKWDTLTESESVFKEIVISVGTDADPGFFVDHYTVPRIRREFIRDLHNKVKLLMSNTNVVVSFVITNILGQTTQYGKEVVFDTSAPTVDQLDVVTSTTDSYVPFHLKCQLPRGFIELRLRNAVDKESGIDQSR